MALHYKGKLYRALNPLYAGDPLSGRGAALYGGRFNRRGMAALYCSLSVMTALRESNQVGSLQPTTLVCYDADVANVFDTRDETTLRAQGMNPTDLAATTWRDQMMAVGEAKTQAFAARLIMAGHNGMLVSSFAAGATEDDLNLVLWRWGTTSPARLTLIDDEGRLAR